MYGEKNNDANKYCFCQLEWHLEVKINKLRQFNVWGLRGLPPLQRHQKTHGCLGPRGEGGPSS